MARISLEQTGTIEGPPRLKEGGDPRRYRVDPGARPSASGRADLAALLLDEVEREEHQKKSWVSRRHERKAAAEYELIEPVVASGPSPAPGWHRSLLLPHSRALRFHTSPCRTLDGQCIR